MKNLLVTVSIILCFGFLKGQPNFVYALQKTAENKSLFCKIDFVTGNSSCVSVLPEFNNILTSFSAINTEVGMYYFLAQDTSFTYRLYTVNLSNGEVINDPVFNQSPLDGYTRELQIHPTTGVLYAIEQKADSIQNQTTLISMDPVTGNKTTIGNIPDIHSILSGLSAINGQSDQYLMMAMDTAGTSRLYSISLLTGDILSNPIVDQSQTGGYINELAINKLTNQIYALHRTAEMVPVISLITINPVTGTFNFLDTIPDVLNIQTACATINLEREAFLFSGQDTSFNHYFFKISLADGSLISKILSYQGPTYGYHYEMQSPDLVNTFIESPQIIICSGDSARLTIAGDYEEYLWSNGDTTRSIYVSDSASYSAIATKNYGTYATTGEFRLKLYDCGNINDTLNFTVSTCQLNDRQIASASTSNIEIAGNNVIVQWNFLLMDGQEMQFDATYDIPQNGNYVISCQLNCPETKTSYNTFYDVLEINHHEALSTNEKPGESDVSVFPNPAKNNLTVDFKKQHDNISFELLSINGQQLTAQRFNNADRIHVDVSGFQPGFYLVRVTAGGESKLMKIIING